MPADTPRLVRLRQAASPDVQPFTSASVAVCGSATTEMRPILLLVGGTYTAPPRRLIRSAAASTSSTPTYPIHLGVAPIRRASCGRSIRPLTGIFPAVNMCRRDRPWTRPARPSPRPCCKRPWPRPCPLYQLVPDETAVMVGHVYLLRSSRIDNRTATSVRCNFRLWFMRWIKKLIINDEIVRTGRASHFVDVRFVHEHEPGTTRCRVMRTREPVLHGAYAASVQLRGWTRNILQGMEDATMPRVKQASKQKRVTKAAAPALGAAGLTFSLVGGASAAAVPTADVTPMTPNPDRRKLSRLVRKKSPTSAWRRSICSTRKTPEPASQVAWRGCGGCRGCRGCRACRACRVALAVRVARLRWRLLRVVGSVAACAKPRLSDHIDKHGYHGRVRRGRPGQSMLYRLRTSAGAGLRMTAEHLAKKPARAVRNACTEFMTGLRETPRYRTRTGKDVLQFAPNFTAYVLPPDVVCLYSEDRKFFLHGELYCALGVHHRKKWQEPSGARLASWSGEFPPDKIEEAHQAADRPPLCRAGIARFDRHRRRLLGEPRPAARSRGAESRKLPRAHRFNRRARAGPN